MISSALALLLLVAAPSATAQPRKAYNACLKSQIRSSLDNKVAPGAFEKAVVTSCSAEEAAFRAAVIAQELAAKASRKVAEQTATGDVLDYQDNAKEMYREYFETGAKPM